MLKLGLREIANNVAIQQIPDIVYANDVINNGVINDRYQSLEQINFLLDLPRPVIDSELHDTSHVYVTGRGEIPVPFSTDYYFGEVL
jgi:hypothetical protein